MVVYVTLLTQARKTVVRISVTLLTRTMNKAWVCITLLTQTRSTAALRLYSKPDGKNFMIRHGIRTEVKADLSRSFSVPAKLMKIPLGYTVEKPTVLYIIFYAGWRWRKYSVNERIATTKIYLILK